MPSHIKNKKKNRKIYVKKRYLPIRISKLYIPFYETREITDHYKTKLSLLLPNVNFSFNIGDLYYYDVDKEIIIPDDSNLHNINILQHTYDYIIISIFYNWGKGDGHVSVSIVDINNKIIEWFDTIDTQNDIYEPIKNKIKEYLPDYEIFKANREDIQKDDSDLYCQTWIYYYIYHRLYKKKSIKIILDKLMSKDKKRRIDVIRQFHHKIVK